MEDHVLRVIARDAGVRGLACWTTNLVAEAARRHGARPTAAAALGEALTGAALFGASLKVQQRVAIKFEGGGRLGKIIAEADSYGRVRGFVSEPEVELPLKMRELDTAKAVGSAGKLTVVKDLRLKQLFEGVVSLSSGDIDRELTHYLNQSEQTPSLVATGVDVAANGRVQLAGGLLIQSLPPHGGEEVARFAERLAEVPPLIELLRQGMRPIALLDLVLGSETYEILEKRALQFKCSCSRERSEQALVTLGQDGIEELLATEGQVIVDCHFCLERYIFDREELEDLLLLLEDTEAANGSDDDELA